jgi:hypothetical protein
MTCTLIVVSSVGCIVWKRTLTKVAIIFFIIIIIKNVKKLTSHCFIDQQVDYNFWACCIVEKSCDLNVSGDLKTQENCKSQRQDIKTNEKIVGEKCNDFFFLKKKLV